MQLFSMGSRNFGSNASWILNFALLAAALILLPGAAHADSGTTYDVTGTFTNGVTINSGSSFVIDANGGNLNVDGATIDTSVGDFYCPPDAPMTNGLHA